MPKASVVPKRNDATRITPGVVSPNTVDSPSSSDNPTEAICKTIKRRRRSTASPIAPAGSANRNTGRLVAACTSVTMIGVGRSSVISHAVPTLPSQMPIFEARLASHTARKVGMASGVQAVGFAAARLARRASDMKRHREVRFRRLALRLDTTNLRSRNGTENARISR